jgi:hypothetical protein
MGTKLSISSGCARSLSLEKSFELARENDIGNIEIIPLRWTTTKDIERLSSKYNVDVTAVHFPLRYHTTPLWKCLVAENSKEEKLYRQALVDFVLGPGKPNCAAVKIAREFPEAYLELHPDTFHQIPEDELGELFRGIDKITFENERPKKGVGIDTYDVMEIKRALIPSVKNKGSFKKVDVSFDIRHLQIASAGGYIRGDIKEIYREISPERVHFVGYNPSRDSGQDIPDETFWRDMASVIKSFPPEEILIEVAGARNVKIAREMIIKNLESILDKD